MKDEKKEILPVGTVVRCANLTEAYEFVAYLNGHGYTYPGEDEISLQKDYASDFPKLRHKAPGEYTYWIRREHYICLIHSERCKQLELKVTEYADIADKLEFSYQPKDIALAISILDKTKERVRELIEEIGLSEKDPDKWNLSFSPNVEMITISIDNGGSVTCPTAWLRDEKGMHKGAYSSLYNKKLDEEAELEY